MHGVPKIVFKNFENVYPGLIEMSAMKKKYHHTYFVSAGSQELIYVCGMQAVFTSN